jgi:hypothetical protein
MAACELVKDLEIDVVGDKVVLTLTCPMVGITSSTTRTLAEVNTLEQFIADFEAAVASQGGA